MKFNWKNRKILVTGGASFIGSHLVDRLVPLAAAVRVVDDLSSGKKENIQIHLKNKAIEFVQGDLREQKITGKALKGMDLVIHLAGDHGGRGYIDLHQAGPASN
ncbi:MAG: NAD-dependent epimerase/dehydratase family protein, partial [Candidatus Daviesbacteria bacterium]|nr:NAD-dependent epimerase/dehydratase family protein [Candidatus Daviesbacteria bacterium]